MTLYEQLGGAPAVSMALETFYARINSDPQLSPFFASTDFVDLQPKVETFFAMVAGAPSDYSGPTLRDAHRRFLRAGLNDAIFDRFVTTFETVLTDLGVPAGPKAQVMQMLWGARDEVLGRPVQAGV